MSSGQSGNLSHVNNVHGDQGNFNAAKFGKSVGNLTVNVNSTPGEKSKISHGNLLKMALSAYVTRLAYLISLGYLLSSEFSFRFKTYLNLFLPHKNIYQLLHILYTLITLTPMLSGISNKNP